MFIAEPERASLVESAMTTGFPLRRWLLAAMVTAVSVTPLASLARVFPVHGAITSTSKSRSGPTRSAPVIVRIIAFPVMPSSLSIKSRAVPKRLSVEQAVSLMRAVTSYSSESFSASAKTLS